MVSVHTSSKYSCLDFLHAGCRLAQANIHVIYVCVTSLAFVSCLICSCNPGTGWCFTVKEEFDHHRLHSASVRTVWVWALELNGTTVSPKTNGGLAQR